MNGEQRKIVSVEGKVIKFEDGNEGYLPFEYDSKKVSIEELNKIYGESYKAVASLQNAWGDAQDAD